ncbi:hypothetical protein M433DRAFT_424961 [Acidomyces richmondensis BFW]|nr:hypothetical protein M433DRAFT_424961 [Acidomyces richmondensis BFW]
MQHTDHGVDWNVFFHTAKSSSSRASVYLYTFTVLAVSQSSFALRHNRQAVKWYLRCQLASISNNNTVALHNEKKGLRHFLFAARCDPA